MQARFSTAQMTEFQQRAALVTHAMRDQGVSQLLVTHPENIYWLTGATFEALERPFFLLLRQNGQRRLLVPTLEADHLGKAWGLHADGILRYREFPAPDGHSWIDALLQPGVLDATFAYEDSTPASIAAVLNAEGGRALDVLSDLRMIKSAFEIALIATAARYADWGVAQI
ncbi:MAG: aminopeptidase P family N-terminal domain-containing protein, partial [Burkholderiales bacterium]|nr:aminopeptidase P family N-terminal domain-containing protein [Burkholderiales bacterium]